jgi:hypothetical protein
MILNIVFERKSKLMNQIFSIRTYFSFTYIVEQRDKNTTRFTY